jgi:3',5'-cyclic AMP phosphodiesterase CpdA
MLTVIFPGCGGKEEAAPAVPDKTSQEVFPKIEEIIYPTLGYPQIVPAGEEFTLEFDFTADNPNAAQPGGVDKWHVGVTSSNGYVPYAADLEVTGVEQGASRHWPEGSGREVYDVYLVTTRVPEDIPPDLYDLEVRVEADGREVVDSQPNSLSVNTGFKPDYRFIQVSDIHVFDVEFPGSCMRDREPQNAVYLNKAVEQINLIHPDFVVFTGDLIFGQKYMPDDWPPDDARMGETEYEYEYLWAYEAMSELDVPCFMVMGNHDGYNDTAKDGYEWWTESFGPLYYSFDYGNHHYTMIDAMDWSRDDRTLEKGPFYSWVQVLQPVKWQGQARSGGDKFGDAQAPPPEAYGGQLAWIRDDLAAHQDVGMRIACCHHDPAQVKCWDDADYAGYRLGGKGEGRLALQRLCADYRVSMLLSGHEHNDLITEMAWTDGQGSTIYANTTALEPRCGRSVGYPGYRMVEISGDRIISYNYQEPKWSYPYYKGIVPGQENDLDPLYEPAITYTFSNGGDWSGRQDAVTCAITNNLNKDFKGARLEFYMPAREDIPFYRVSGSTEREVIQMPEQPDWVIINICFDLPALSEKEIRVGP